MSEHPSLIINQKIFDDFINSSIALFKQIKAKENIDTETITQEEADFANTFFAYTIEVTNALEEIEEKI